MTETNRTSRRSDRDAGAASAAPLRGLVLCGGRGTRLGRDKGEVDYHGRSQAEWLHGLLRRFCADVLVSIRPEQAGRLPYARLPVVEDRAGQGAGPAAGLLAAWDRAPDSAWLVVASDLPLVDVATLEALTAARDSSKAATAFRHPDGTPEPLCSIWEPRARESVENAPGGSLRRVLERVPVAFVAPPDPERLASVNTPADDERVRGRLRVQRRD